MKKPPDPYLPAPKLAVHRLLPKSASSFYKDVIYYISSPLQNPVLPCKVFPLIERIWKRSSSNSVKSTLMMKIFEELVLYLSRSSGFTVISLPEVVFFQIRVEGHLRIQPSSTGVLRISQRECVITTSFIIKLRRWIWRLNARFGCIQWLLQWKQPHGSDEEALTVNGGQRIVDAFPGVTVPQPLPFMFHTYCYFLRPWLLLCLHI